MDYTNYETAPASSEPPMAMVFGALVVSVVILIAGWKVFTKAKKPGWAIFIPLYNIYTLLKIVGRPGWWLIWYFIPFANIVVHIIVSLDFAKSFKRSGAFGIFFLFFFPIIGYLILGFGKSKYVGAGSRKK